MSNEAQVKKLFTAKKLTDDAIAKLQELREKEEFIK